MTVDTKIKALQNRMKTNSTVKYKVFLCVFSALILIFGTSKFWLPSDVKVMNTALGSEMNTSTGTSIKLRSWEYSKINRYMEITFDVHNNRDSQSLIFTPVAHTNTDKRTEMNINTALNKDGSLVIQIKDVPKQWDIISLRVLDNMNSDSNINSMGGANFYCDIRKVSLNDLLTPKSELDYQVESIQNQIADVEAQIKDVKNQIQKANTDIDQLNFDIQTLKDNQKYQTKDEVDKSNSVISSKSSQIDTLKNTILKYQKNIEDYNVKLQKLNLKLEDTKNGKSSAEDVPPTNNSSSATGSTSENVTLD